jgi:phosphate transport system permease protein
MTDPLITARGLAPAGRTRAAMAGARQATVASLREPTGRRDRWSNLVFRLVMFAALATAIAALVSIIGFSVAEGRDRLDMNLFTEYPSNINRDTAGYRPAILGSLYVIGGVIGLIVPLGVGASVYLEEYADKRRWYNRFIELNIQNLAGVPAIVFGILGLAFIVRGPLSLGFVAAAGSITLALLVLPTVILASREAIRSVPSSLRDGSLALGATEWQTIRRQVLANAVPGILTGVILAVSRAIGEAAPLLLVGAVTFVTFDPDFTSSRYTALPVQIYNYAMRPQPEMRTLAMAGVIVIVVVLLAVNSVAIFLRHRYDNAAHGGKYV